MKKKVISVIMKIVILSIGITIGKLCDWGYFELSKEISIIDALTLLSTLGVAIYITKTLEKEVNDNRIEKDLFLAKIGEIEQTLIKIEEVIESENCQYSVVNNKIHSCRRIKTSVFKSVSEVFSNKISKTITNIESLVNNDINILKRLLTETPVANSGVQAHIHLENGIATYTQSRQLEINVKINSIKENLFKLKVRINNI